VADLAQANEAHDDATKDRGTPFARPGEAATEIAAPLINNAISSIR
jgi:hypothetical protein